MAQILGAPELTQALIQTAQSASQAAQVAATVQVAHGQGQGGGEGKGRIEQNSFLVLTVSTRWIESRRCCSGVIGIGASDSSNACWWWMDPINMRWIALRATWQLRWTGNHSPKKNSMQVPL